MLWVNFPAFRFKKGQRFRPQQTKGDMSVRFTSNKKNHAAGAECTIECVEAASTAASSTVAIDDSSCAVSGPSALCTSAAPADARR